MVWVLPDGLGTQVSKKQADLETSKKAVIDNRIENCAQACDMKTKQAAHKPYA